VLVETPCTDAGVNSKDNSEAFRRLAKYIGVFGQAQNDGKSSIAMTAPVINTGKGEKVAMTAPVVNAAGKMAFVLPSKYKTVEEAPKPIDPLVSLRQLPERDTAVLTFYGTATDAVVEKRAAELAGVMTKEGIPPLHPPTTDGALPTYEVLRYNPPFTLPPLRTNEVLMEVQRQ
jgi:hypothetical protein